MNDPQASQRSAATPTRGYTLVEMVVVMAVLGIVGMSSSYVVMESMKVYARTAPAVDASYQARLAAERLRRDVRGLDANESITAFTATDFAFTTADGLPVAYAFIGGELLRNGGAVARGLSAFEFRFLDDSGGPALDPLDLHLVDVRFTLSVGAQSEPVAMAIFPRGVRS